MISTESRFATPKVYCITEELVDNEFKWLNIVVDEAFKFALDAVCHITNPNVDVDVAFKLLINKNWIGW